MLLLCTLLSLFIACFTQAPQQVHISSTGVPSQLSITWFTQEETTDPSSSIVKYGIVSGKYGSTSSGIAYQFSSASNWTGTVHNVMLNQLQTSTTYYYVVGSSITNLWSSEYQFNTLFAFNWTKGQQLERPLRFAWFGDMGYTGSSIPTVDSILQYRLAEQLDTIFHVGDIAYCDFNDETEGNQSIWNDFMQEIEPIAATTSYMVCPGNHDVFFSEGPYLEAFPMPTAESGVTWYTFDILNIRFIAFSTEDWYIPFSEQRNWLVSELERYKNDPNSPPWLIIYAHRPIYCSNAWSWCNGDETREILKLCIEDLLQDYGVDLFIAGHTHSYERTYPVYHDEVLGTFEAPKATVHLIIGTPGDQEGLDMDWQSTPKWSVTHASTIGWGYMTVYNDTHLSWDFILPNGTIADQFWLQNGQL